MIASIDRVRTEVLTGVHAGLSLDEAMHAAAVTLCMPLEAVREALEREESEA